MHSPRGARQVSASRDAAPIAIGARRLDPLTSLRFFAALLVVVHHFAPGAAQWSQLSAQPTFVGRLCTLALNGFVGVDLFFVLSGFILAYTYRTPSSQSQPGGIRGTVRSFWRARFARIYPLYALAYAAAALPFLWSHDPHAPPLLTAVTALTLTQAWIPQTASMWNPPGWSLSVEVLFYVLFPLLLPALSRLPRRRYTLALLMLCLICCAVPLLYLLRPNADVVWLWAVVYNPVLRLPEFVIGMLAGLHFATRRPDESGARFTYFGIGALALCLAASATTPASLRPFVRAGALDPLFALLIYALAVGGGPLAALFSRRALVLLGEASYALYILHWPLWDWLTRLSGLSTAQARTSWAFYLDYLGIVIAVSVLAYWTVERPARAALRGRLG